VHQLAQQCGEAGRWLHWGATTQDIMDTATVLQVRDALALVEADLAALEAALAAQPVPGPYDWAGHVAAQRLAAEGWIAHAEGRDEAAVDLLAQAAERDEAVGKHPVTPGAILPPRELLADLLLELNRPADALREYEAALRSAPNRFNGLYGAARAATAAGDAARARELYAQLVAQCAGAPGARPELARAREQIAAM
jgi:adenylosuccinate lyase